VIVEFNPCLNDFFNHDSVVHVVLLVIKSWK